MSAAWATKRATPPKRFSFNEETGSRRLENALLPTVEGAIRISVRRNPKVLVDALFPVMGPAIRRAIAATLRSTLEAFSRALEYSLSPRSIKWRWEAWRTGRSFAEVVLLRTLVYRVEQVLLIQSTSGLLMQHVEIPDRAHKDLDLVSGMLTAIQDFVSDSFKTGDEALEGIEFGELRLWIERGPGVALAALVRGTPPNDLKVQMAESLEEICVRFGDRIEAFTGDPTILEPIRPLLEECLQWQAVKSSTRTQRWGLWALALVGLLAVAGMVWSVRQVWRWNSLLETLESEPGIVVTRTSGWWSHRLHGLRDPLARDPGEIVAQAGFLPSEVEAGWSPFHSLEGEIVLRRARRLLKAPREVQLRLQGSTLIASGRAPAGWIRHARQQAEVLPGIERLEEEGLVIVEDEVLQGLRRQIESRRFYFDLGSADVDESAPDLREAASEVRRLLDLAGKAGIQVSIVVVGQTDATGSLAYNRQLSVDRARRVVELLAGLGVPQELLRAVGEPSDVMLPVPERSLRRRVTFSVQFEREGH